MFQTAKIRFFFLFTSYRSKDPSFLAEGKAVPGRFTLISAKRLVIPQLSAAPLFFQQTLFYRRNSHRHRCWTALAPILPYPPTRCTCAAVVGAKLLLSLNGRSKNAPRAAAHESKSPIIVHSAFIGCHRWYYTHTSTKGGHMTGATS